MGPKRDMAIVNEKNISVLLIVEIGLQARSCLLYLLSYVGYMIFYKRNHIIKIIRFSRLETEKV